MTRLAVTAGSALPRLGAACGAAFLWGTGSLVVNLLVARHGYHAQSISFWRFVLGGLVLLAVFGRAMPWARLLREGAPLLVAGAVMAAYVLCWFVGIARIGAAVPTLIALCLPPVFVTAWALARGRQRASLGLVAVLAAAIGGTVMLVAGRGADGAEPALALPSTAWLQGISASVGSALLYAGFTLVSPGLSRRWGAGVATTALTLAATLVMALSGLVWPLQLPREASPEAWLLYLGMITAALALLAFSWGAARLSPTALTIATLVEPLTAVLLAAAFLGERLRPAQWLGALLLMASIWGLGRDVVVHEQPEPGSGPGREAAR
jgi:DME family drug/metabolite transporter